MGGKHTSSVVIAVRVPTETKERLEVIAQAVERKPGAIVLELINAYVAGHQAQ